MDRRDFLKTVSGTALGAMAAVVLPPLSARAADQDTLAVTLTAERRVFSPVPGLRFHGLAYNGRIPGPLLRVRHGQTLRVNFLNRSGGPSTVHWHGMILPNDMDGVPGISQTAVPDGGRFEYAFTPGPPGTRWYHSHVGSQQALGLFGGIIVDDPRETPADVDVMLIFHDVPDMHSYRQALQGRSQAPMVEPPGAPELSMSMAGMGSMPMSAMMHGSGMSMPSMMMQDEVAYVAHCINGAAYPRTTPIKVRVGQRVRFRILNASPTETRYVRLAGHSLRITHSDGNPLSAPVTVEALRIGVAERYDVEVEITRAGAWLLQGLTGDPLGHEQAVRVYTEGMEQAAALRVPASLEGVRYFTYDAAGVRPGGLHLPAPVQIEKTLTLSGGMGGPGWRIDGRTWPHTPRIAVRRGDRVLIHFRNHSDMDHPMHLHGHVFQLLEVNGKVLRQPLAKDTALVPAMGGTATWLFTADSPPGRWLLHCHNAIHMEDGMMTEVDYV